MSTRTRTDILLQTIYRNWRDGTHTHLFHQEVMLIYNELYGYGQPFIVHAIDYYNDCKSAIDDGHDMSEELGGAKQQILLAVHDIMCA
jgi:hypothetical protein